MNLIRSICCFFSSRCASGAADTTKADEGRDVLTRDAGTPPAPPRPANDDTENSHRSSSLNLPAVGGAAQANARFPELHVI